MSAGGDRAPVPEQLPSVRWLRPSVLLRTGLQVILSSTFARFADKREQQAGIDAPVIDDLAAEDDLWFDYVADVGDGFDATATVAHLLARPELRLAGRGPDGVGEPVRAPQGSLLVMGGDQVYPYASVSNYQDRLIGPYQAMFPWSQRPHPIVVAVPGNHDWYDGLTSFMRIFAQRTTVQEGSGGWVGGWRTAQARSYFAVQLPHRWWLWGIDIQLETYIDGPQIEYFSRRASELQPGDAVILCCSKPGWLHTGPRDPEGYALLDFFERRLIRPTGAHLRVSIAGDHHSYARYEHAASGEQKIVAGGGGAFLAGTHHFATSLELPPTASKARSKSPARTFTMGSTVDARGSPVEARYPSADRSRSEARQFWRILTRNGWSFPALMATYYGITAAAAASSGWLSPPAVLASLVGLLSLWALASDTGVGRPLALGYGALHAAAHLATVAMLVAGVAAVAGIGPGWSALATAVLGLGVGTLVFAFYLYVADLFGVNTNELFSGQRISGFRCFLRFHLTPAGDLVVYPIGVDESVTQWVPTGGEPREPSLRPAEDPAPRLIDGPVVVRRDPLWSAVGSAGDEDPGEVQL